MKLHQIIDNFVKIDLDSQRSVYYSYETPVAVNFPETEGFVVSENIWSRTTGKHLDQISHKNNRLLYDQFERILGELEVTSIISF